MLCSLRQRWWHGVKLGSGSLRRIVLKRLLVMKEPPPTVECGITGAGHGSARRRSAAFRWLVDSSDGGTDAGVSVAVCGRGESPAASP